MRHLYRRVWAFYLVLLVSIVCADAAVAADDRPVKMSEVARLVKDQSPQDILAIMAERGVGFRVTSTAESRLEKYGFTEDQIALIRKMAAGEAVDLNGGDAEAEAGEAAEDKEEALKVGFPDPDHWHRAEQARIERAIKNAGLGYNRIELTRVTLYCNAKREGKLVPLLKNLESALIKRFPATISSASSPKSAHIVIVDGTSEWSNWVDALMDSYEKDGMKFSFGPEADARTHLKKTSGFFLPALATAQADMRSDENVSRFSTYALGHLMMARAGGKDQPAGLTTGFGDLAEATAMGTPSVMIYSYEKRDLKQEGGWKGVVKKLFEARKIDNVTAPWGYTTDSMKPENYAECWSLVSTLAEAPGKFAEAVRLVREDNKFMNVAVDEVYGMGEKDLLKAWYKWVSQ